MTFSRLLALSALVVAFGAATTASAQNPAFNCTASVANPPLLRAEGLSELVGDIVLGCFGGPASGNTTVNVQIFVNTNITSRLLANGGTDAVLLVNDPIPGAQVLGANIYQGALVASNSVAFLNVILPAVPSGSGLTVRITNVRANTNALGAAPASAPPNPVIETISLSSGASLSNPNQTVGFIVSSTPPSGATPFLQCSSVGTTSAAFTVNFGESFPNAFKLQGGGSPTSVPGTVNNTESGLIPVTSILPLRGGGQADFATRVQLTFTNVGSGVNLLVPTTLPPNGVIGSTAKAVLVSNSTQLTTPGSTPSPLVAATTSMGGNPYAQIAGSGGVFTATYEIIATDSSAIENFAVPVFFSFPASSGAPPLGTVAAGFAPVSTVIIAANSTVPIPRFTNIPFSTGSFDTAGCAAPSALTATAGTPQSTAVGNAFPITLQATVRDASNSPVAGVTVSFTAPASGASGTFAGDGTAITAQTNAAGVATAPIFTANNIAGPYVVNAAVVGVATPAIFNLTNTALIPPPAITSLNPISTTAGSSAFTLTLIGTGFLPTSTVQWTGPSGNATLTPTSVNPAGTQLTVTIGANLIAQQGQATLTVLNGSASSNTLIFPINAPAVITSLNPNTATAGTADFPLIVTGTNFAIGATVNFNGQTLTLTSSSSTQLIATVPRALVASAGPVNVTVTSGGVTSAAAVFTITPAGTGPPTAGNIIITGHDDDYHASSATLSNNDTPSPTAKAQLAAIVKFARAAAPNPALPVLIFDQGTELQEVLTSLNVPFDRRDPSAGVPDPSLFDTTKYSAIGVASDKSCGPCDNDNTSSANLALAKSSFQTFVSGGGGIFAFAAAGSVTYYNFLPKSVAKSNFFQNSGFQTTSVGDRLGIPSTNGDFAHDTFPQPGTGGVDAEWEVVENYTGSTPPLPVTLAIEGVRITTGCPLPSGIVNVPYPATALTEVGLTGNLTWSFTGALPNGLSLTNGTISGTPRAAGISNFILSLTDGSRTTTKSCSLAVNNALTLTGICPATVALGAPFSIPLTAAGGTGQYSFQPTGPPWISLGNTTGVAGSGGTFTTTLNGTPPVSGAFATTVTVLDGSGAPGAGFACTLMVPPSITSLNPNSATAGGSPVTFAVNGAGFAANSTVQWNGTPVSATFVSATQLTVAAIPASLIPPGGGTVTVTVLTQGVNSNGLTFTINPPAGITLLTPNTASARIPDFTLTITGANFFPNATVNFNGQPLTPGSVTPTQLIVTVPAALVASQGTVNVTVTSGGATSTPVAFIITPASTGPSTAGNIVISGHDDDYHASSATIANRDTPSLTAKTQLAANVKFARAAAPNPALPVLIFDQGTELQEVLTSLGVPFDRRDPSAGVPDPSLFDTTKYSAIGVASDKSCGPCDNDDTSSANLASAKASFQSFVASGGGIFAFAAAGSNTYYNFLPRPVVKFNFFQNSGFQATAVGNRLGIPSPTGDYAHNTFPQPGTGGLDAEWEVVETYTAGSNPPQAVTLAIEGVRITTGCPLPSGTVNFPYSALTLTEVGLSGNVTWSGTLPSNLTLSPGGVVSGVPTAAGSTNFTLTATDGVRTATKSCGITINTGLQLTGICPAAVPTGVQFSIPLRASGGDGNYTLAITSGPAWLSLSGSTVIGTPPAPGVYPFTVTLMDRSGTPLATFSCSINVLARLSITGACPAPLGNLNAPYVLPFLVSGGNGNYLISSATPVLSLAAAAGTAPIGGAFSDSLSGTFTSTGSYLVSVQVSDTAGSIPAASSCYIAVNFPRVTITSGCPASSVMQGTSYSQRLSAAGGDGNYAWSLAGGTLPPGLILTGNTISGTPAGPPAQSSFTIQASSNGMSDQVSCSITVAPATLHLTTGCPGDGVQGSPYGPVTLAASGGLGAGSYAFSVIGGGLPAGLNLFNNTISGTPTGPPGMSSFRVQVTSGTQTDTSGQCALTIAPPAQPLKLSGTCPATPFALHTAVSVAAMASGGQPPYSFVLTSGPSWFSAPVANGSSVTVGGTATTTGSFNVTLTVTDKANTSVPYTCPIQVSDGPPQIMGTCPGAIDAGSTLPPVPLTASGGTAPYTWAVSGNPWTLTSTTGQMVSLTGTPQTPGQYPFTVTLNDSAGLSSVPLTCSVVVNPRPLPALAISSSTGCPAAPIDLGSTVSIPLQGTGGQMPYNWSFGVGVPWLSLNANTGSNVVVTGKAAPPSGTVSFTVSLGDNAGSPAATFRCALTINPAVIPPVTIGALVPTAKLTDPLPVNIALSAPSPVPLDGILQLSFTPNAFGLIDNPQVAFLDPSATNGGRLLRFQIPAGSTQTLPSANLMQQGNVAGTIRVEVISLRDGDRDVLPANHPFSELVIPRSAPVLTATDVTFDNESANGFDVLISGYSTPRDMVSADLTFTASQNATIDGSSTFNVKLDDVFASFYKTSKSLMAGSAFMGLRIPVIVEGDKTAIGSVAVTLTNSAGKSATITKNR